jgi:predicted phosphodiesterase
MKYFSYTDSKLPIALFSLLFLISCASYKSKFSDSEIQNELVTTDDPISIYLIGDAGNADLNETTPSLKALEDKINKEASKNDMVIFLGDNLYERGLPPKEHPDRLFAEHRLNVQIDVVNDFEGKVLFIPGNHDWYFDGLPGLKRQEEYIEKELKDKDAFQPEKGCPIESVDVSDYLELLIIDTQWFLEDWDDHPTINDRCDIKTREDFFLEIESVLKKNNSKTIVIAMHHPAFTSGTHGGYFNFKNHLFPMGNNVPMPILGSLAAQLRGVGGVSPQDRSNTRYTNFMDRLTTLVKGNDKVILVSGHDHNLQYIENEGINQIVSGSGSKNSPAALGKDGLFSSGESGFAKLDIFENGSSQVGFYSAKDNRLLYRKSIYEVEQDFDTTHLNTKFNTTELSSVYDEVMGINSKSFNRIWGDHYRYVYGTKIKVPVATLDTLYGGMELLRTGGGHQTRSIRLKSKEGRTYAMRAVKKSAVQFLQSVAFKDVYVEEELKNTLTEELILDFYTSSHPYATFTVSKLSEAIGLYHTNPRMYYIPKHPYMGNYNAEYGDELYIIEERPDDTFLDQDSFGRPDDIESTNDVIENIRKDEKYTVDQNAFIKARLFDMMIGDWDRHYDQWRWSRFNISDDEVVYRPIPRDRDQAFSNYDGSLLDIMKVLLPPVRQFQTFEEKIEDIDWLNLAGIKIDRTFLQESTKEMWISQARFIQENLTDVEIDLAFSKFPVEVQDETISEVKRKLKNRRDALADTALEYYNYLSELVIITATDKDDHIEVIRGDNFTKINISRIKDGEIQEPYRSRVVYSDETKEIWIYALDDDDRIEVKGNGTKPVKLRIIGGQNNDTYNIQNGRKVKIYDHKSKPNTLQNTDNARIKFQDIYSDNVYDYRKRISDLNSIIPFIGSNPDDGVKFSIINTYTVKGFKEDPFQHKHQFAGSYYFATQGFDLNYNGIFSRTFGLWDLLLGVHFSSDNYAQNFFGYGNETINREDDLDLDYNRVRKGKLRGEIGLGKKGFHGSNLSIKVAYERIEVEPTYGRFIVDYFASNDQLFDDHLYSNIDLSYTYSNYDLAVNPTRGMNFEINTGIFNQLSVDNKTHGYIVPKLEFYNSITSSRKLVLKTMVQGQFNLGNDFEFFHAANLGASTGLRGYRNERFSGNSALVFGGDIRYGFNDIRTGFLPFQIGIFTGYDIGRVWVRDETSDIWHDDFGGGFWVNAIDTISAQIGMFAGDEGPRITFGFGMDL